MPIELEGSEVHLLPCKIEWEGESDKLNSYFVVEEGKEAHFRGRRLVPSDPLIPAHFGANAYLVESIASTSSLSHSKHALICKVNQIVQWHHDEIDVEKQKQLQLVGNFIKFAHLISEQPFH